MALLGTVGWGVLYSPWSEWAPEGGARWPSLIVAFAFGLTGFLTLPYYPLLAAAALASTTISGHEKEKPARREIHRSPIFRMGAFFLIGFLAVYVPQQMGWLLGTLKHGVGGNSLLEPITGGLFLLIALVSLVYVFKEKTVFGESAPGRIARAFAAFTLGLAWGIYYGRDFDHAYDRAFFRVGAGPGSHEVPALFLFGVGLLSLHFLWSWGWELWVGGAAEGKRIRLGACAALLFWGSLMLVGFRPFAF